MSDPKILPSEDSEALREIERGLDEDYEDEDYEDDYGDDW